MMSKRSFDVEYQYQKISGNWGRYFSRIINTKNRKDKLTVGDLEKLYEKQKGRCAISGEQLTCILIKGQRTWTNASLDRINPDIGYELDNIQLVCTAVNSFKNILKADEYITWCKKVVQFDRCKNGNLRK
jgi:hypothetical protein